MTLAPGRADGGFAASAASRVPRSDTPTAAESRRARTAMPIGTSSETGSRRRTARPRAPRSPRAWILATRSPRSGARWRLFREDRRHAGGAAIVRCAEAKCRRIAPIAGSARMASPSQFGARTTTRLMAPGSVMTRSARCRPAPRLETCPALERRRVRDRASGGASTARGADAGARTSRARPCSAA